MKPKLKGFLKRTVAIVTLATVLLTFPSETFAKAKTVKALQCLGVFSDSPYATHANKLSDIPIIKSGTIVKTNNTDYGFVKYKVPKTGKYEIKIYDYKFSKSDQGMYVTLSGGDFRELKVSGLNNKKSVFELFTNDELKHKKEVHSSEESFNKSMKRSNDADMYYGSKTVTAKLKKGEYLYIQTWLSSSKESRSGSYKVAIKAK